jgi:hypothetical protein
LPSQN